MSIPTLTLEPTGSTSFVNNMALPIHRWFRFSAGFSAEWVRALILEHADGGSINVFDPFAGSGTTLIEAQKLNCPSIGVESHPMIYRIAKAKVNSGINVEGFRRHIKRLVESAEKIKPSTVHYPDVIKRCFLPGSLDALDQLRRAHLEMASNSMISELTWLAITGILRTCSHVGTAQWQYLLPNRTKARVLKPFAAFEAICNMMAVDISQNDIGDAKARIFHQDIRGTKVLPTKWADLVITSPPYANNYDYADATRLELCFWGEINGWGDLQSLIRPGLVRSCTQHVSSQSVEIAKLLASPVLDPIRKELGASIDRLRAEKKNHGGKKSYDMMALAYFYDMGLAIANVQRTLKKGGKACFVIGDSAPYGVYLSVDKWLGLLAINAGFKNFIFEKVRDRNTKWKNRKHTVPLHEGRLWLNN